MMHYSIYINVIELKTKAHKPPRTPPPPKKKKNLSPLGSLSSPHETFKLV